VRAERRSDEERIAWDGATVGELYRSQAVLGDDEAVDRPVDDRDARASSIARSLAVTGWVCVKRIRSSVHAATGALFDVYDRQSAPQMLLTVPEMIWELTFGIHLVPKGFTTSATRQDADARQAPTPVPALG
jgi:hypothetical protein